MTLGHHLHHKPNYRVPGPVKHPVGALTLEKISRAQRVKGGYRIVFHGHVPRHASVRLFLGNSTRYSMDITEGYHKHHMTHLALLLDLMDQGVFWGKKVQCRVALYLGGKVVEESLSPAQFIQCPLQPIEKLGLAEIGSVEGLRYTGKADGSGKGAFLCSPIGGKYYFAYDRMLETDPERRGFDCTTYVGSAFGLANGLGQGDDGKTLAEALHAEGCNMERKDADAAQQFVEQHKSGTYIMWRDGHVVAIKDGTLHEFTNRKGNAIGHQQTEVESLAEWFALPHNQNQRFSIRKLKS